MPRFSLCFCQCRRACYATIVDVVTVRGWRDIDGAMFAAVTVYAIRRHDVADAISLMPADAMLPISHAAMTRAYMRIRMITRHLKTFMRAIVATRHVCASAAQKICRLPPLLNMSHKDAIC